MGSRLRSALSGGSPPVCTPSSARRRDVASGADARVRSVRNGIVETEMGNCNVLVLGHAFSLYSLALKLLSQTNHSLQKIVFVIIIIMIFKFNVCRPMQRLLPGDPQDYISP